MAKLAVVEVTKWYPDGRTEKVKARIQSSEMSSWFMVDAEQYFWPKGTRQRSEVEYRPTRVPYKKMTAILTAEKWEESCPSTMADNG